MRNIKIIITFSDTNDLSDLKMSRLEVLVCLIGADRNVNRFVIKWHMLQWYLGRRIENSIFTDFEEISVPFVSFDCSLVRSYTILQRAVASIPLCLSRTFQFFRSLTAKIWAIFGTSQR